MQTAEHCLSAEKLGGNTGQLALAWVANNPNVSSKVFSIYIRAVLSLDT